MAISVIKNNPNQNTKWDRWSMIKVISNLWLFGWIQSSLSIPENPICNSAINIAIMHFYPYRGSINEAMKLCVPCFFTRKKMISQNYESTKNTCKHTIKTHAHQQKTLLIMASIRSSGCKMPFFLLLLSQDHCTDLDW